MQTRTFLHGLAWHWVGVRAVLFAVVFHAVVQRATAQASGEESSGQAGNANGVDADAVAPARPALDDVRVMSVRRLDRSPLATGADTSGRNDAVRAGIGDLIVIKVRGLHNLTSYANCMSLDGARVPDCQEHGIALYLDGREIKGMVPESGAPLPDEETLQFHLQRSLDSDEAWADLLGAPSVRQGRLFHRPTKLSVGLANVYALPSDVDADRFELIRVRKGWLVATVLIAVIALVVFVVAARRTGMLRDGGIRGGTFSLSRCQMAFWTLLTVIAFVLIWSVTGALDVINGSVIALMGIGAGTLVFARAADTSEASKNQAHWEERQKELLDEIAALQQQIAAAPAHQADPLRQRLAASEKELVSLNAKMAGSGPSRSVTFFNDILSDSQSGIAVHRFQMVVWTLVLGVLFIHSVWYRLSMPEFSATLLALMGISSGTYLGLKVQENQAEA